MIMTQIYGAISGIHPFSDEAIRKILDYKYKRVDISIVHNLFQSEFKQLEKLQQSLGFPYRSSGLFGLEDLIRPFTRNLETFHQNEVADLPIVRYHYTNTFYREPVLVKKLPNQASVLVSDYNDLVNDNSYQHNLLANESARIILPGPISFISMISKNNNEVYRSDSELIEQTGEYLAKEIESLPPNYEQIQLDEPHAVWNRVNRTLRDSVTSAYEKIREKNPNRKLIINTYFESCANILPYLLDLPVDGIGIDFNATNILDISEYSLNDKILQAGIIDAQNFVLDESGKLDRSKNELYTSFAKGLLKFEPKELIISANTSLSYLPRVIADQKLEQISEITNKLKEEN
jgi:methionine synthase II (cobalamin-independent)